MFVAAVIVSTLVAAAVSAGLVYLVHRRVEARLHSNAEIKALVDRGTAPVAQQLEERAMQTEQALASVIADVRDADLVWKSKTEVRLGKTNKRLDMLHRAVCEIQKTGQRDESSNDFRIIADRLAHSKRQTELLAKRVVDVEARASKALRKDDLSAMEREIGDSRARIAKLENDLAAAVKQRESERQAIDGRLAQLRDTLADLAADRPDNAEALTGLRADLHADLVEFSARTDRLDMALRNVSAGLQDKVETSVAKQLETLAQRIGVVEAPPDVLANPVAFYDARADADEEELREAAWAPESPTNGADAPAQRSTMEGTISLPTGLIAVMANSQAFQDEDEQVGQRDPEPTDDGRTADDREWRELLDAISV